MRRKHVVVGFALLLSVAATAVFFMKLADRPAALKDSFTVGRLDKESRTGDGFFAYTSEKNGYSMLYPETYVIDRGTFQERSRFESWRMISKDNDAEGLIRSMKISYNHNDSIPEAFFERYSYEGEFETLSPNDSSGYEIYIGYVHNDFDEHAKLIKRDPAEYGPSLVICLIKDPDTGETMKIHSSTVCPKKSSCKKVSLQSEKEFVIRMAKSVEFQN
ncbi:hypothetical protein AF331_20175 [Rossellomorea marisflavi]|uniref:Uncharacterized protein n=1 Tax=Rossellomorea marisflavi TaxID=189381 RepID=A0A0M0G0L8_9BACI|nr:hypothetical protein [Rossellomorea marisflavi]KON83147.1 hypothetical protein AF331_20175 [Rossellomorea marisflavi]MCM2589898.1 hypothetical protein [Rossellomorea marisflavi]